MTEVILRVEQKYNVCPQISALTDTSNLMQMLKLISCSLPEKWFEINQLFNTSTTNVTVRRLSL
jgi:hypothetical protein